MRRTLVNPDLDGSAVAPDRAAVSKVRNRAIAARCRETQARLGVAEGKKVSDREIDRRAGLAEGHTAQALRSLEQGKTITVDTFLDIATGLAVDPGWLLTGAGGLRLGDLPEWPEIETSTRARYKTIPDFAIRR